MRKLCADLRAAGQRLGFVPTMGALHEGHLSLVRFAAARCDHVVVSVFVNPLQFGPNEDLDAYPRQVETDCQLLEAEGVDGVFVATTADMYPEGFCTTVSQDSGAQGGVSCGLEGAHRPGHFDGVLTVVLKLLNVARPDVAVFGRKDYQQGVVIRRMAADLDLEVAIEIAPTIRDTDGLALSSRNRYLSPAERGSALALPRALQAAAQLFAAGERSTEVLEAALAAGFAQEGGLEVDYAVVRDPDDLSECATLGEAAVALAAVRVGKTRLIDNLVLGACG